MSARRQAAVIFGFFLRQNLRSRRNWLLLATAFIPVLVLLTTRLLTMGSTTAEIAPVLFRQMAVPFLFTLYIPLLALLSGSACVGDETDQRTLVFLTTRPVGKPAILLGKAAAQILMSLVFVVSAMAAAFLLGFGSDLLTSTGASRMGAYILAGALAALAYSSLFVLFGTLMKKPVIAGIIFIFGWEYVVQFIPGSTQQLTISHYVKSLLPYKSVSTGFLMFQLEPSSTLHATAMLLILAAVFLLLAVRIFRQREYVLSEPRL